MNITQILAAATSTVVSAGRVVGAIPSLPQHFVLREQFRELAGQVAGSRVTAVVTGMRGVGKTQLAAAYARAALTMPEFELVGWVDAETPGALLEGLTAIATHLGVEDPDGDSHRSATRLRDHLNGRAGLGLLVFDNAVDPDRVAEFVPNHGGTRVVITSTDQDFTTLGAEVDLEVYERPVSVRFLHEATAHHRSPPDDAGADGIAAEVGDLPLALTQAAATITARRLDYSRYRELLAGPLPRVFTRRSGEPHRWVVDKAILLSIQTTRTPTGDPELDTAVTDLLDVVAMLSATGVPRDLLPDYAGRRDEAIARCVRGSLLAWSADDTTVVMHRLIARVLRDRADTDRARTRLAGNAIDAIEPHLFDHSQAWQRRTLGNQLIEHIEAITTTRFADHDPDNSARLLETRIWAGIQLVGAADLPRGIDYTRRTLLDTETQLGTEQPHTLITRADLAYAYALQSAGRVTEAIDLYERLLPDQERILGAEHRDTSTTRANLAYTYQAAGRVAEAIDLYERLLPDQERILGAEHRDTLAIRARLAYAYRSAERVVEAIGLLESLLPDQERILGAEHPDTLATRASLADSHAWAGRGAEAIDLYQRLLPDRERILGAEHPDTLTTRHNLAFACVSAARAPEAIGLYERLLPDRERILGAEHPDTLATRANLAYANQEAGRVAEAIDLYERLLPDHKRILGAEHPNTLMTRHNLAGAYESAGRGVEAIGLYERLLPDQERILGAEHPDTLATRHDLAYTYHAVGQIAEAIDLYEWLLPVLVRVFGHDAPIVRGVRKRLAAAHRRQKSSSRWARIVFGLRANRCAVVLQRFGRRG
ncbi:tetratricopeptide repeat protein [Nocardia sp. KC 131]|uniref:tetratricopeptide repeat protein n=1 Tax=Nocardia arseniciresistens TaxID=3392119 RepID=UPI00398F76DE